MSADNVACVFEKGFEALNVCVGDLDLRRLLEVAIEHCLERLRFAAYDLCVSWNPMDLKSSENLSVKDQHLR